jgi:[acyl-carrier-protein] S-malonyltransferase
MGRSIREASAVAHEAFERVSEVVGRDVAALCDEADEETLRFTENAQIALYACGVATAAALREKGVVPSFALGHSVGEYAALAAAGVISLEDGARLVDRRGELMAQAKNGTMAAIIGLDDAQVEAACSGVSNGIVVVANYNSPGQVVISGEPAAVEAACTSAKAAGARRVVPLNVSGAFHSPLMEEAAAAMRSALATVSFAAGTARVASNVLGDFVTDASAWPELLARQIASPVRWTDCVRAAVREGASEFFECGPGSVLCGLLRRIEPEAKCIGVAEADGLAGLL